VLVGAATLANAQSPINVGIKAGVNLSTININSDVDGFEDVNIDGGLGLVAGGFVRINLGKISIQPEVLYSQKKFSEPGENGDSEIEYTINEIDVPVLIGIDLVDAKVFKLRLVGGPMISLNIDNKIESGDFSFSSDELDNAFEEAKFGYVVGLSADVTKLTFDLRYNGQLSDTFSDDFTGTSDITTKTSWVQFTVGFKFL
jgi:Outer membrane protein beta-barrel domain